MAGKTKGSTGKKSSQSAKKPSVEIDSIYLHEIATVLDKKFQKEERETKYAPVKEILSYLAKGGYMAAVLVMPGLGRLAPDVFGTRIDYDRWKHYNYSYLKRSLKRLRDQKMIEVKGSGKKAVIKITNAGKTKVLDYALSQMGTKKPGVWDGKWRIVIYDIPSKKRKLQDLFRKKLKQLGLVALQKSVYITPYDCERDIEFIKKYFGVGEGVLFFTVSKFDNDKPWREYFGLR
jgi:hypothetical protein